MNKRPLGKGGPMVPVLGFGAWPISGGMGHVEEDTAIDTIHAAIDHGITLIDTAQGYRSSEGLLGRALQGGLRDKCFLATKVTGNYEPSSIRAAMENSLRQLRVDYVDLYQVHHWNPSYPIDATMETLAQLQAEGKTRLIGVSNFYKPQMQQAMSASAFQTNQLVYNLFTRQIEGEDMAYCEEYGVGIMVHSPLAKGLLAGKYRRDHRFGDEDERSGFPRFQGENFQGFLDVVDALRPVAADKGLTMLQFAIAWTLRPEVVSTTLIGAKTRAQIEEVLPAADVIWTDEDIARVEAALVSVPNVGIG